MTKKTNKSTIDTMIAETEAVFERNKMVIAQSNEVATKLSEENMQLKGRRRALIEARELFCKSKPVETKKEVSQSK